MATLPPTTTPGAAGAATPASAGSALTVPSGYLPRDPAPSSAIDPAIAESQAQQLTSASLSGYGALPNPQMVYEAIQTGATTTLQQAYAEGNPAFEAQLAGTPAGGQVTALPYSQVPATIPDPNQNLYAFDWKSYWSNMHGTLEDDKNASWRSFGQVPVMNLGWMQGVRSGDSKSTTKWQNLFKQKGYLDQNYQASGVWDQATEAAFQGFMIQWATPYALFSNEPKTKANATQFLDALGLPVASLDAQAGRDPEFLAQVAQNWMAAQGPDSLGSQKTSLQHYADQFGQAALPQSYQAVLQGNVIQTVRDGLESIFGFTSDIPGIGGALHGAENVLTGNWDMQHLFDDPRVTRAQQIQKQAQELDKLTPQDLANLKPVLDEVKQDAGFLGFMDDYDHTRTKFILAAKYMFSDLASGKFDWTKDNPFDPMSQANLTAQPHQDNLYAGLFGDQAAQDAPAWAGFFNFAANVLDDPTSYIPLVGELDAVQKARGIRTVSRLIGKDAARSAFNDLTAEQMRTPITAGFFNATRTLAARPTAAYGGLVDSARMMGLSGMGGTRDLESLRMVRRIVDPATADDEAWSLLMEGDPQSEHPGFGWLMQSGRGFYNANAAWKGMASVKSTQVLGKARVMGMFEEMPFHYARTNPVATGQFLQNAATVAGMSGQEIRPLLDQYLHTALDDPNAIKGAFDQVKRAVTDAYFQKNGIDQNAFRQWVGKARQGRTWDFSRGNAAGYLQDESLAYMPNATTGQEMARAPRANDPTVARQQTDDMQRLQQDIAIAQRTGAHPDDVAMLQDQLNAISRPAPGFVSQLADEMHFPYSLYEMVAYKNPAARTLQSVQSAIHLDAVMGTWKRITLGRISSAFRINLGDDAIRPFAMLIGTGHFIAGFHYLTSAILRSAGLLVPGLALGAEGSKLGPVPRLLWKSPEDVPEGQRVLLGPRQRTMLQTMRTIEQHPEVQSALQTAAKYLTEYDSRVFRTAAPTDAGYALDLQNFLRNHLIPDPQVQTVLAAEPGKEAAALEKLYRTTDDPALQGFVEARRGDLSNRALTLLARQQADALTAYLRNPELRAMVKEQRIDTTKLRSLVKQQSNDVAQTLPIIPARIGNAPSTQLFQRIITGAPERVFEAFTKPMVDQARARGFVKMQRLYEAQLRRWFRSRPWHGGDDFEQMVAHESSSRALDWIMNNTYQGGRSVMGGMLRNVFPFYGATVNMDRFWMRQAAATPFVGSAVAHAALASQQSQNAANQAAPGLTGFEGVLSHLGFGAGEGVQFNPLHAFFLTSDGIGSMVPGTGPMFAPLWTVAGANPTIANLLADVIPGAQTQIDYNTGQARPMFSWLADLISGSSLALTGQNIPGLGMLAEPQQTIDRMVDQKVSQRERETGHALQPGEVDSIRREVGRDLMLQGGLSFTAPVSPQVIDVQGAQTQQTLDQWRQTTDDTGKDALMAQTLGVNPQEWSAALQMTPGVPTVADLVTQNPQSPAALMAYMDRRVSPEDRDAIASAAPWVVSASTSKYQTSQEVPGEATSSVNLAQWQIMRNLGDVTLLNPDQYVSKINKERDINTGWLQYDALKNLEFETLQANGWSTKSKDYSAWKSAVFDPAVIQLENTHPDWATQFAAGGGGTSPPEEAHASQSLRGLQTWEVIPQHSDYESTQSVLWRNALQLRDQAAQQIYAIKASHGSQAEMDMVMAALQQQLAGLAQQDPNFAAQLNTYRFSAWEDIVHLEASELQAQQYAGPVPRVQ